MMTSPAIPIPPSLARRYARDADGRAWLASLPGLIERSLAEFSLVPDLAPGALPWSGHGAVVIPVLQRVDHGRTVGSSGNDVGLDAGGDARRDAGRAVLKLAYPHEEARTEAHALALWDGRGAVRALAADPGAGALLLERLEPDRSLQELPFDAAAQIWGGLVRKLSLAPEDRPEWREFEQIAARAERWSDEFPERWELLGRPFPRWLLEAALEVCQTRGAVGRRSGMDVLVHADLHFLNVLARPGTPPSSADPAGYKAIDPQPVVGEAEFAVAPLLWNRLAELPSSAPARALVQRCLDFSAAAGLDGETARQWAVAREVDNALWYAEAGHDGDLARSLWVASTLAGHTLDGLPGPQVLPAAGGSGFAPDGP